MIRVNDIVKHCRFKDVAFKVTKPPIITNTGNIKLRGLWLNQGFVETIVILPNRANLKINSGSIKDWLICSDPTAKCVRNVPWNPIK